MTIDAWFVRHAQTLIGSLGRIAEQPLATAMTATVIAVALALPLLLNVCLQNVRSATAGWNQALDVTVYLDKKAGAGRAQALAKQWRTRPDVAGIRVILADEALTQFRVSSGFGQALDALTENPLPDALVVTPSPAAANPQAMGALEKALAASPDVQTVEVDTAWVERLQALLQVLHRVVILTGLLLGLGVLLVVGNTIRLDILNRRTEIEVMKLVGATDGFTRRPFLYTGAWYGLTGGVAAILLVAVALRLLRGPVERLAGLYGSTFTLHGMGFVADVVVLAVAVALGWGGSWLAATRHIRQIEPT
jgi:cell division transport system permease protein